MIKGIVKVFILTLFFFSIASCEKKSCKDVVCGSGLETCTNGVCLCKNGLEGDNCEIFSADKYVGNYVVYESCPYSTTGSPVGGQYNAYMSSDPGYVGLLYINNVLNQGQVSAYIRTDAGNKGNIIVVPQQSIGAITIAGQGVYDEYNHRINIDFSYNYNFNNYQCTHTFYKQ